MPQKIEDILEGKTEEPESTEAVVEVKEESLKTETPAETVEPQPEPAPEEVPAMQEQPEQPNPSREAAGLKAAATAEKKKRQALEQKFEQMVEEQKREREFHRQQMMQFQQQFAPKQPEQPVPGIFDDPQAWERHQQETIESRLRATEVRFSERLAKRHYGVEAFAEAETALQRFAQTASPNDPVIIAIRQSDDPAEVLMQWHQQQKQLSSIQNPEGKLELLKEALKDESLRSQVLSIIQAQAGAQKPSQPARPDLPNNLAGARSVGVKAAVFTGPTPLNAVIGQKKK